MPHQTPAHLAQLPAYDPKTGELTAVIETPKGSRNKFGSVATFGVGRKASARRDQLSSQAASWNSSAMNAAWALMSLPPMFRTCPFLIIAIAS